MAKLVWDKIGEKKYETGVRKAVLYPMGTGAAAGTYPKGVAWNVIRTVSETPSGGEPEKLYADDQVYVTLMSVEELGGTIGAYMYPDEWMECDGSAELAPGVYVYQQERKTFGLCYRTVSGNDTELNEHGYKLHLIYNALTSPSEREYETINDSPAANEMSWEYTTTPVEVGLVNPKTGKEFKPTSLIVIDSTAVDAAKLKKIEDMLYGTDTTDARLPLPAEIYSILMDTSTSGTTDGDEDPDFDF